MPTQSMFSQKMELSERTLVRRMSPAREPPEVHSGLLYANGTVCRGGKLRGQSPRDTNSVIAPPEVPPTPADLRPKILNNGIIITVGRRHSPHREYSLSDAKKVTGRKHVAPTDSPNLTRDSPSPVASPKRLTLAPPDHDVINSGRKVSPSAPERQRSGLRPLEGPPPFEPPPFQKRAYSPQLKRVASKPRDNDIFLTGVQPSPTNTVRRGGAQKSVSAQRCTSNDPSSPNPMHMPRAIDSPLSPRRSSIGASGVSYNILTCK